MDKKIKILVTGGSGFIGTNLIEYLLENYKPIDILNIDIADPKIKDHFSLWKKVDILDKFTKWKSAILLQIINCSVFYSII